ncbi:MAG TPA: VOC family protein [Methylomirabilota bacterium]|nr:VOC family protein [Methylomirabilota bacterium]
MPPIRLDHIAIALPRIADAPSVLVAVLGGVPERMRPAGAFRWASWTFAGGGRIEILEPTGADGFLHRFLAAHGPGVHHVTFKVPDLDAICRRAERHGYGIVGREESDPTWREAFLHPKQALGIVVQLTEAEAAPPDDPGDLPPGLPGAPPPVRILGLRMRAHSRERALTQWRDILRAEVDEGDVLTFRWPDSPMRILVEVDPTAAEGPLAIELVSERGLGGLDAASTRLGIRLAHRSGI